jgi:hypothetical protein
MRAANEIAAVDRVYQISPNNEPVDPLLSDGLDSAWKFTRISAHGFVLVFSLSVIGFVNLRRRRHRHRRSYGRRRE